MKVIANKPGYFTKLREAGDVFEVPEGETASWFDPVEPAEKPARGKKAEAEKPAEKPADGLV